MPIDYDIHSKLCCSCNSGINKTSDTVLVAPTAVSVAVTCIRVHGKTYQIGIPVISYRLKCILIHIIRKPCDSMCAHTFKLIFAARFIHYISSLHRQLSVIIKWCSVLRCFLCIAFCHTTGHIQRFICFICSFHFVHLAILRLSIHAV